MDQLHTQAIVTAFAVTVIANCLFSNLYINILAAHAHAHAQQRENDSWATQELIRRRRIAAQRRRDRRTQRVQPYRPPLEYIRAP